MEQPEELLLNEKSENEEKKVVLNNVQMQPESIPFKLEEKPILKDISQIRGIRKEEPNNPHEVGYISYGRVFANDLAKSEVSKTNPIYPVGSIFVREKLLKETDENPEVITAMVKREKGFSSKTGDWEYFTFNGADFKLTKRETKGDCAKCHANAKDTDFVFKQYLK